MVGCCIVFIRRACRQKEALPALLPDVMLVAGASAW